MVVNDVQLMLHFLQTFLFSRENARPASRDKGYDGDVYCWNDVIVCLYFAFYFLTLIIHQYSPGHAEVDNANGRSCASASRLMNVHKFPKPEKKSEKSKTAWGQWPSNCQKVVRRKSAFFPKSNITQSPPWQFTGISLNIHF